MSVIRDRIALLAEQYVGTVGVFRGGLSRQQLKDAGSDDDKDIYQVDKLRGADLVIRMVKEMNPGILEWTPKQVQALRDGQWLYASPPSPSVVGTTDEYQPGKFDWCGIFAGWIWKQAGLNVHWVRSVGIGSAANPKPFELVGSGTSYWKPGAIQKGDICVMNNPGMNNQHYYIVVNAEGRGNLRTVEGNLSLPRQSIGHRSRERNLIVTHYRLLAD